MCYQVRLKAALESKVLWQWLAGDEWIAYDFPSGEQLETAYQAGADSAQLTAGYFEGKDGYRVEFRRDKRGKLGKRAHQLNTASGMRRTVRRVADDDDDLFVPVAVADVAQPDRVCQVCQDDLTVVALKKIKAGEELLHDYGDEWE